MKYYMVEEKHIYENHNEGSEDCIHAIVAVETDQLEAMKKFHQLAFHLFMVEEGKDLLIDDEEMTAEWDHTLSEQLIAGVKQTTIVQICISEVGPSGTGWTHFGKASMGM